MKEAILKPIPLLKHIVLGGGGSKGVAHVAALTALKRQNRLTEVVSYGGTSAGAMVAYNMSLGMPLDFIKGFMGLTIKDNTAKRYLGRVESTNLLRIVKQSRNPIYFPNGMFDLSLTMMAYGKLGGGDPLHVKNALEFDHPIVLEQLRLLEVYKKYVNANKRDFSQLIKSKSEVTEIFDVLERVERITLGEWGQFIDGLSSQALEITGLKHYSCTATVVSDVDMQPITFTSLPRTLFSEFSEEVPMILAMAASASFPWALPPVHIKSKSLEINCVDGGIFQNLPYTRKLFLHDPTLLINLGHKPVQESWDTGVFYNSGSLKRMAMSTMFKRVLVVPDAYLDCVNGFPIDDKVCVIGLNEFAYASNGKVIETLTPDPTQKQLDALYDGAEAYLDRVIESGEIVLGSSVVDFAGTPYGEFMRALKFKDRY